VSDCAFLRFGTLEVLWGGVSEFIEDREPKVTRAISLEKELGPSFPLWI
jgi:hypothetical protein